MESCWNELICILCKPCIGYSRDDRITMCVGTSKRYFEVFPCCTLKVHYCWCSAWFGDQILCHGGKTGVLTIIILANYKGQTKFVFPCPQGWFYQRLVFFKYLRFARRSVLKLVILGNLLTGQHVCFFSIPLTNAIWPNYL